MPPKRIFEPKLDYDAISGTRQLPCALPQARTHVWEVVVVKVEPNVINKKVTGFELDDPRSTMCVSSEQIFVEVLGELTPPRTDEAVRLLRFNRFNRFESLRQPGTKQIPCALPQAPCLH